MEFTSHSEIMNISHLITVEQHRSVKCSQTLKHSSDIGNLLFRQLLHIILLQGASSILPVQTELLMLSNSLCKVTSRLTYKR